MGVSIESLGGHAARASTRRAATHQTVYVGLVHHASDHSPELGALFPHVLLCPTMRPTELTPSVSQGIEC